MESEGELLKAEKLYSIVVDERVLDMLEEMENERKCDLEEDGSEQKIGGEEKKGRKEEREGAIEKIRLFNIGNRTLELEERNELTRDVEGNASEGSNGWIPKSSEINGKIKLVTLSEIRRGLEEGLEKGKQERGLRGNCMSSKLLVRTQKWKKDGALLVRTLNCALLFPESFVFVRTLNCHPASFFLDLSGGSPFRSHPQWNPHHSSQRRCPLCWFHFVKVGLGNISSLSFVSFQCYNC